MNKELKFASVRLNQAFSPAKGQPSYGRVFIKKANGICPCVSTNGASGTDGIFYPTDDVTLAQIPFKFIKPFLEWTP